MLRDRFLSLRDRGERALVLFVTAGDPDLEELPEVLDALVEAGADVIELGIPFSDPIADGPTIQASSQRALDRGVTPSMILDKLSAWNGTERVPVVLMGYLNPILRMGYAEFAMRAKAAGAAGVLISDLTPEEAGPWLEEAERHGLETVFLVAPTSTQERVRIAANQSTGFVYALSRTGVTGTESTGKGSASEVVERIRSATSLPVAVGFGISKPEQVAEVCAVADGAIIGSALVQWLATHWNGGKGREALQTWVRELKQATRSSS